jgi:tetratricopeptide (TPR) repeat protein/TolB-like protein
MKDRLINSIPILLILFMWTSASAQQQYADTVIVMPFENETANPEHNWVGESFAEALSELMRVPGLTMVTNAERRTVQQRLGIPVASIPSLATALRIARESRATILIMGSYRIIAATDEVASAIDVTVRMVRTDGGRIGEGSEAAGDAQRREVKIEDALSRLRRIQGLISYQLLVMRDRTLPFPQVEFVKQAEKVPARAFEAYIKGLLTPDSEPVIKERYFINALKLRAEEQNDVYSEAALELGHFYIARRRFNEAVEYFSRIGDKTEFYPEAAFYAGLVFWQQANFNQALAVLSPLADELALPNVYNTLGAIAIQSARNEKKDKAVSSGRLTEGIDYLRKGIELKPDDRDLRFNYGLALFTNENFPEAVAQFRELLSLNPSDGEGFFLLAKALEMIQDPSAFDTDNQSRRLLVQGDRYARLQTDWQRAKSIEAVNLRVLLPPRRDFVTVVLNRKRSYVERQIISESERLLQQIRLAYVEGRDADATQLLNRLSVSEPMSAEGYLIRGQIHLRQGEMDDARDRFKTALFWDNGLIDAHIALVRIFLAKNDCQQATTYLVSAEAINPDHSDLATLRRQVERCSR